MFFFLIIDLYFLIPGAVAQIFNPIAELAIPIGIPTKEAKADKIVISNQFSDFFWNMFSSKAKYVTSSAFTYKAI